MELDQAALELQTRAYLARADFERLQTEPITHGGSGRTFYRLTCEPGGNTYILMHYNLDRADNAHFVPVTRYLSGQLGVAVPELYGFNETDRLVWLEDLGEVDLWSEREQPWSILKPLYRMALDEIWKIHRIPEVENFCALQPPFDERLYLWEQSYFVEHFLRHRTRLGAGDIDEIIRLHEWRELATGLAALPRFLVHRDFQSRNIMICRGRVCFIDYQGLRWGRPEYDLASVLLDPYVDLGAEQRDTLLRYYYQSHRSEEPWEEFYRVYLMAAAQRLMQALGAYGNLGRNLGKAEFFQHIPTALNRLRLVLKEGELLPALQQVLREDALTLA